MTRNLTIVIVSVGAMLLGACASTPPSRFYLLEPVSVNSNKHGDAVNVGIGPFAFPDYLKRPQIVTRTSGSELKMAEFDRWAEPLDDAFLRHVAMNVDSMMDTAIIVAFPYGGLVEVGYRVVGEVSRFDMDASGTAFLQVQWLVDAEEEHVVRPRSATYSAQVADPDDYASVVSALDQALASFSRDVADALTAAITQRASEPE